jgi:hypothetical protein
MTTPCPICDAKDPSEKAVADMVTAAVVWYKAPLEKRAAAEAALRRHVGNLLHQPEEATT